MPRLFRRRRRAARADGREWMRVPPLLPTAARRPPVLDRLLTAPHVAGTESLLARTGLVPGAERTHGVVRGVAVRRPPAPPDLGPPPAVGLLRRIVPALGRSRSADTGNDPGTLADSGDRFDQRRVASVVDRRPELVPLTTVSDEFVGPPQEPAEPFRSIGKFERLLAEYEANDVLGLAALTGFSSTAAPPPVEPEVAPPIARSASVQRPTLAASRRQGLRASTTAGLGASADESADGTAGAVHGAADGPGDGASDGGPGAGPGAGPDGGSDGGPDGGVGEADSRWLGSPDAHSPEDGDEAADEPPSLSAFALGSLGPASPGVTSAPPRTPGVPTYAAGDVPPGEPGLPGRGASLGGGDPRTVDPTAQPVLSSVVFRAGRHSDVPPVGPMPTDGRTGTLGQPPIGWGAPELPAESVLPSDPAALPGPAVPALEPTEPDAALDLPASTPAAPQPPGEGTGSTGLLGSSFAASPASASGDESGGSESGLVAWLGGDPESAASRGSLSGLLAPLGEDRGPALPLEPRSGPSPVAGERSGDLDSGFVPWSGEGQRSAVPLGAAPRLIAPLGEGSGSTAPFIPDSGAFVVQRERAGHAWGMQPLVASSPGASMLASRTVTDAWEGPTANEATPRDDGPRFVLPGSWTTSTGVPEETEWERESPSEEREPAGAQEVVMWKADPMLLPEPAEQTGWSTDSRGPAAAAERPQAADVTGRLDRVEAELLELRADAAAWQDEIRTVPSESGHGPEHPTDDEARDELFGVLDDHGWIGRLSDRLYPVLRNRLRGELLIDRERRGVLADLR